MCSSKKSTFPRFVYFLDQITKQAQGFWQGPSTLHPWDYMLKEPACARITNAELHFAVWPGRLEQCGSWGQAHDRVRLGVYRFRSDMEGVSHGPLELCRVRYTTSLFAPRVLIGAGQRWRHIPKQGPLRCNTQHLKGSVFTETICLLANGFIPNFIKSICLMFIKA